ncbi:Hypothetical protein A7982_00718 [Minicystis rosea]|nr:Hypothetical protein A7982_00718 [Minicystis rosea]
MPTPLEATTGQRIAGGLLIANATLTLIWAVSSSGSSAAGLISPGASVVPAGIDLLIGVSLVRGRRALVPWATVRLALGLVVFTAMQFKDPFAAVAQAMVCGGILLLLVGNASKVRIALGSTLFGLYALVAVLGFVGQALGENFLREAMLRGSGEIEREPVHLVTGVAYPYTLELPGKSWHLRKEAIAKRDQPLADRWILRPDKDAHLITIVEHLPGQVLSVEAYTNAVLEGQKKASKGVELIEKSPLRTDPEGARLLHTRFTSQGMTLERYIGVVSSGERGFQIIVTVEQKRFAELAPELRQIVESFKLPAEAAELSPTSTLEPSPAGEILGLSFPYHLTVPSNRRWYLRKDEVAKKDQPLADRWLTRPDMDAHVMVIAEHVPGLKMQIDPYADAVLDGAKSRASAFAVVKREPLPGEPVRGRLIHTTATMEGGLELDFLYGVVSTGDRGFQVICFTPHASFPAIEAELRQIIASFKLPPG